MVGLSIIITIIQKTISLILTWYQSKTNNQQPSIAQQPSSPAFRLLPYIRFSSSSKYQECNLQIYSLPTNQKTCSAKLLSPIDNQELHYSAASTPQSSFSIMAPTATYGVSPAAAIISLPNTEQVMSLKLSNTNFLYWRMQMKPFLLSQGVYSFVDGTSTCPPFHLESAAVSSSSVNPAYLTWKQQDHLIISALLSSLSVEVL
jgi:hypothetical protein